LVYYAVGGSLRYGLDYVLDPPPYTVPGDPDHTDGYPRIFIAKIPANARSRTVTATLTGHPVTSGTKSLVIALTPYAVSPKTQVSDPCAWNYVVDLHNRRDRTAIWFDFENLRPVAYSQDVQTCKDTAVPITLRGYDACGEPLTFSIVSPPTSGSLSMITPIGHRSASVTYTPNLGFCGYDSFTFNGNDGVRDSNPATVTINVGQKPYANSDLKQTCKNTPLNFNVSGYDPCGGTVSFELVRGPDNAQSFSLAANGSVSYTPAQDFCGSDSFDFEVVGDCGLVSDPATVSITVGKKPSASSVTVWTCKNTPLNFTLTGSDPCGAMPVFEHVSESGPTHARFFSLSPNGSVSYTPAVDYVGVDSFQFKVLGDCEDSDPATVTIQVDQIPVAHCQDVMVKKDQSITFNLTGFGGQPLTFSLVPDTGPYHAQSFSLSANGSVTYVPQSGYESSDGPDGFDFTVSSCGQISSSAHVTINVVPGPALTVECYPRSIVLKWTLPEWLEEKAGSYIKDFLIYRCATPSGVCTPGPTPYAVVDDPDIVANPALWTFTDTNVTPGTIYCYRLTFRHRNACSPPSGPELWESPYSNTECSTTCCPPTNGPFWTDYNVTAHELAQWIVGPNFTVQNAKYTGATVAKGIFGNGFSANFPINTGVILSSGDIALAKGPNNLSGASRGHTRDGDQDLNDLLGAAITEDAAVLEFDVVSLVATNLAFDYVFASEEYPEFSGSMFKDLVAIWVNGVNIATVPNKSLPVGVHTINGGCVHPSYPATNPEYYVDNHDPNYSALPPYAAPSPVYNLEYDGATVLLRVQMNISANTTNHIKIAIADASDAILDSAVFIKALVPCQ
jgi:hypothetical protein